VKRSRFGSRFAGWPERFFDVAMVVLN